MVKFLSIAQFSVDHLFYPIVSCLIFLLGQFTAFAYTILTTSSLTSYNLHMLFFCVLSIRREHFNVIKIGFHVPFFNATVIFIYKSQIFRLENLKIKYNKVNISSGHGFGSKWQMFFLRLSDIRSLSIEIFIQQHLPPKKKTKRFSSRYSNITIKIKCHGLIKTRYICSWRTFWSKIKNLVIRFCLYNKNESPDFWREQRQYKNMQTMMIFLFYVIIWLRI